MVLKTEMTDMMIKHLTTLHCTSTPSKPTRQAQMYAGFGAAITVELMISFWFGVGGMLAVGVADGLDHFTRAVTRGK